jgi:hypothetical protein
LNRIALITGVAAVLASCQQQPGFNTSKISTTELMAHVIDPAAYAFWRGSGQVITEAGVQDLAPTTPEGWKAVEDGATTLAEAGNLLMLPGRPRPPEAQWNKYAKQLTERALEAREATVRQDNQAIFDTGGKVYEVCVACHAKYISGLQTAHSTTKPK